MIKKHVSKPFWKKLERRSNMILRRPSQTDKEAILEMMAEFEREQAAHDGGFWNANNRLRLNDYLLEKGGHIG